MARSSRSDSRTAYWNDFVGDLTSLTTADVNKSAGRLIHPDALTWVVVGDLAKIEKKCGRSISAK